MLKSKSIENAYELSKNKVFWSDVFTQAEGYLRDARKRVSDLEVACRIFKRNASIGAPIPSDSVNPAKPPQGK